MNTDGEEPFHKAESKEIVVDAKVIETITDREAGQTMNCLKITGPRMGYNLNFKHPKVKWNRVIK